MRGLTRPPSRSVRRRTSEPSEAAPGKVPAQRERCRESGDRQRPTPSNVARGGEREGQRDETDREIREIRVAGVERPRAPEVDVLLGGRVPGEARLQERQEASRTD